MNISNLSVSILCITVLVVVFMLDKSRQKQIDRLRNEFASLLSVVNSIKFRVFNHENQLLERDGVYVPEDTGRFAFNLMWSILDEKTKSDVQEEYNKVCPNHIPLWKYVIYSYKFSPKFERKIEMRRIESVEDLINGTLNEVSGLIEELKSQHEQMNKLNNEINSIVSEAGNFEEKINEGK